MSEKVIKALEHFKHDYQQYCDCSVIDDAIALLKSQPQIVRCINCKWYKWGDPNDETVFCKLYGRCHDWNFFCADGEPKGGEVG